MQCPKNSREALMMKVACKMLASELRMASQETLDALGLDLETAEQVIEERCAWLTLHREILQNRELGLLAL